MVAADNELKGILERMEEWRDFLVVTSKKADLFFSRKVAVGGADVSDRFILAFLD